MTEGHWTPDNECDSYILLSINSPPPNITYLYDLSIRNYIESN